MMPRAVTAAAPDPSVPEEPAVGQPALVDLESQALVQAERPGRVLGVDPERRLGHAGARQAAERFRGDRPPKTPAPPRPAHADVLEPAAIDAERRVLLGPDPGLDDPGDLVKIGRAHV